MYSLESTAFVTCFAHDWIFRRRGLWYVNVWKLYKLRVGLVRVCCRQLHALTKASMKVLSISTIEGNECETCGAGTGVGGYGIFGPRLSMSHMYRPGCTKG